MQIVILPPPKAHSPISLSICDMLLAPRSISPARLFPPDRRARATAGARSGQLGECPAPAEILGGGKESDNFFALEGETKHEMCVRLRFKYFLVESE